jgi:uncharacterized protein
LEKTTSMTTSVKDSIDILKKAQEIDRELYLAQRDVEKIPEAKQQLNQELDLEKNRLRELEAEFKKLQMKQKEKDGELGQKEAQIKKLDGQLGAVKTNKEYSALQQEIASLKADNSLLEEDIIRIMDQVEAADEEVKKERERLKQIEKEYQVRQAEMDQRVKAAAEAVESLRKKRDEIVQQVAPDVRSLYDLIVQKKQGLALVKVNGEICGACQLQLRPQLINEIRLQHSVIVCENCSRILYIED